jgi:hypothetical protein
MVRFHSPDEESIVLLVIRFRKDCVSRHIGEEVLTAVSSSHASSPEASQQMMVLPMLRAIDDRSDARLVARLVGGTGCRQSYRLISSSPCHCTD